ncbi:MAG: hypothetical protein GY859_23580 [Desulfobacterales bacterium]|nr:hypothetical protein [Desulfobacterales bacterium]
MKTLTSALIGLLMLLSFPVGAASAATVLKWGASKSQSGLYARTEWIRKIVKEAYPGKISVEIVETEVFADNLRKIHDNSLHIGPAGAMEAFTKYKKPEESKLRSLWGGYLIPVHVVASKARGVVAIGELHEQTFAMNPETTSGALIKRFFDAQGIIPRYHDMAIDPSIDAMKADVVLGWFIAGFKDQAIQDLEKYINILPVDNAMIQKMNEKYPHQGMSLTLPAGLLESLTKPQLSLAYVVNDFVHKDVSADDVHKLLKIVWKKKDQSEKTKKMLDEAGFTDMYEMAVVYGPTIPFHPGAVKFFREDLHKTIPPRLLPPEMK